MRLMKNLVATLAAPALALVFISCASKQEIAQGQKNAFDLSGEYRSSAASDQKFQLTIQNRSSRSDIVVQLDRASLSDKEKQLFASQGIDGNMVFKGLASPHVFGAETSGVIYPRGKNYSDDFGESSTVFVFAPDYQFDPSTRISYLISATIKKADFVLRGNISVSVTKKTIENDSAGKRTEVWRQTGQTVVKFDASSGQGFYTQYFAHWTGVFSGASAAAPNNLNTVTGITISKLDRDHFNLSPTVNTLTYDRKTYTFEQLTKETPTLSNDATPTLNIRFVANDGDRILIIPTIYSLGNMAGPAVQIHGSKETPLGDFVFKRD